MENGKTFEEFNVLARSRGYKDLPLLAAELRSKAPGVKIDEWKLNNLGLQLLFKGKVTEGLNVLSFATILYPNSANAFDSLAEGYLLNNNKDLAFKNFEISLKLDSNNQNAIDRLQQLKKAKR